jgi:GT2 family glycosyltransferase/glycosyltransferase involved in cell wall biosynthesis
MSTLGGDRGRTHAAEIAAIFDPEYYVRQNADVAKAGLDPLAHFMSIGWAECRNPCALFDTEYYFECNPDIAQAGLNPLSHYVDAGGREGRSGSVLFDANWYLARNPDIAEAARANPLAHYLRDGAREGREANPLFDQHWYLTQYPDALKESSCALAHYAEFGASRRLSPHPLFDGAFYLDKYPDVAELGLNPLAHFLKRGRDEIRQPHKLFDIEWYRETYPDVVAAGENPLLHFIWEGAKEGRRPNRDFNTSAYLKAHPDIAAAGLNPLIHFIEHGEEEEKAELEALARGASSLSTAPTQQPTASTSPSESKSLETVPASIEPTAPNQTDSARLSMPDPMTTSSAPDGTEETEETQETEQSEETDEEKTLQRPADTEVIASSPKPRVRFFDPAKGHTPYELVDMIKSLPARAAGPAKATIIVPVFQNVGFTLRCVLSLMMSRDRTAFDVLIVDDASPDGSGDFLKTALAGVDRIKVTQNPSNLGFLRSCNGAASAVTTEFIVFLNNDTFVLDGWLDELVQVFRRYPRAGLAGSKLLYPDGRLQEAGGIIWKDASGANFGRGQDPDRPEFNYMRDADYISGAAIMIPRETWRAVGGFSEEFAPAYYEDTDLAMKVRALGKRVIYQPLSEVVHYEGASSGTDITQGVKRYQEINRHFFLSKWREQLEAYGEPGDLSRATSDRSAKARVLIIDADTPTPDKDSGSVTAFQYMRLLTELGYRVTFIPQTLSWRGRYSRAIQRMGVEVLYPPFATSPLDYALAHGADFDIFMLSRAPTASACMQALRVNFPNTPIIFDTVDIHHLRLQRQYDLEGRPELLNELHRMKIAEFGAIRMADLTILVSEFELTYLQEEVGHFPHTIIPLILPPYTRKTGFSDRRDFAFIGNFNHTPNLDAVKFLTEEIWPLYQSFGTGARLHIIGSNMPKDISNLAGGDVVVPGWVEDLESYLRTIRVTVAPLRYGAGVKGKVGNAMRLGVPSVCTPMAVEGMALDRGKQVLVASTAEAFASEMRKLYSDAQLWEDLSRNGQAFADRAFGVEPAKNRLNTIFRALLNRSPA